MFIVAKRRPTTLDGASVEPRACAAVVTQPVRACTHSLTHSLTHRLTDSLTDSLTHSLNAITWTAGVRAATHALAVRTAATW